MNDLYNRIAELCHAKSITPGKLCSEIGIRRSLLSDLKMERKQTLSAETLTKIAAFFDVSVDYLLGKTDKKNSPVEIMDEEARDEFVGFYGVIKKDLTEGDLEDIKKLMRLRAELNRSDKE